MKFAALILTLALSTVANASGFRCDNQEFKVILNNHVHAEFGTDNPAVLVISSTIEQIGTVAQLFDHQIQKAQTTHTTIYEGATRDVNSGRFIYVIFTVFKTPNKAGKHYATLEIHADNDEYDKSMVCDRYLKARAN
ncbi:MAG: hypothetical protein IT289_12040 [Oligoflexia bacterium]|nr:hypothetical protein [Oligoflexia bacterium]